MSNLHQWGQPKRFLRITYFTRPILGLSALITLGIGLYFGLLASPPDYQQGNTVRIMYIHVPAAYIAVLCYAIMAITSACYLIFRYALADICARCCAQIGACFTVLCLITGSLWGKPMWGTWWVWDARLTSVLVLFFIYCGYIALAQNLKAQHNQKQLLAILAIIGAINLPIIKFSVDWWNTLHQPASLLRADGPSLHRDFLVPLLWMLAGFSCLFFWQLLVAVENTILGQKLQQMRMRWIEE